jgi:hypothetical protein
MHVSWTPVAAKAAQEPQDIWDRWYDFLNIFAKKFGEKIGVLDTKRS